ncbi:hypothetical protein BS50DRAFT_97871 [Corynespora cassiicola Philippines]|uniref:Uncharacterized protein n=1 Tax=Corynespora cassiicola Philippines TaxID=1448308 RepID=A0A2T2NF78_CORCC|nr:hypothetical protein BS50DRAFT_97871 [Corynespora cassiicola Philippines]
MGSASLLWRPFSPLTSCSRDGLRWPWIDVLFQLVHTVVWVSTSRGSSNLISIRIPAAGERMCIGHSESWCQLGFAQSLVYHVSIYYTRCL